MSILAAIEVRARQEKGALVLLDVRPGTEFEAARISGAIHNCVFEVAFLSRMADLVPNLGVALCVYGPGGDSHESRVAVDKLERAGYTSVFEMRGGFEEWQRAKFPIEGSGTKTDPRTQDASGHAELDTSKSGIEWVGRNLGSRHRGRLAFKSGELRFENGWPVGGHLVIDMNSITNANLQDAELRSVLEHHLKSDDFFDVDRFPEGIVEVRGAESIPGATMGTPNLKVRADLTLKGTTHPVEFLAVGRVAAEGSWVCQAHFDIDRTRWNVLYGSGKFFKNLGMHLVNDWISLQLDIVSGRLA